MLICWAVAIFKQKHVAQDLSCLENIKNLTLLKKIHQLHY